MIEPLAITGARGEDQRYRSECGTHADPRRLAFDRLRDKEVVGKLFKEIGPRFKERPGGYLRILKTGPRPGDNAPMAIVMLTDQVPAEAAADE